MRWIVHLALASKFTVDAAYSNRKPSSPSSPSCVGGRPHSLICPILDTVTSESGRK